MDGARKKKKKKKNILSQVTQTPPKIQTLRVFPYKWMITVKALYMCVSMQIITEASKGRGNRVQFYKDIKEKLKQGD